MNNWGYCDPGNVPEPFDPFDDDDFICWLIITGQAPGPDPFLVNE